MADFRNTNTNDAAASGGASATDASVLAAASLADLRALDPGGQARLVQRVLITYQGSLGRLLAQLGEARGADAWDQVSRVAHTLKSSSASIGALALSALCAEIEKSIREGNHGAAASCLQRFDAEVVRVEHAVATALRAEEAAGP